MARLAALGVDPSPLMYGPAWLAPLWLGVIVRAEKHRHEWAQVDAHETIRTLAEAM